MRSRSSEVDTPGVRRVGINLPRSVELRKGEREGKGREHTLGLYKCVHVIMTLRNIRKFVVRNVVNVPLFEESLVDDPWAVRNDLVNPAAMSHSLASVPEVRKHWLVEDSSVIPLSMRHDTACFIDDDVLIGINTNK